MPGRMGGTVGRTLACAACGHLAAPNWGLPGREHRFHASSPKGEQGPMIAGLGGPCV